MTKLPMLVLGLVVATTTVMRAQPPRCTDPTTLENITDNVLRTSGNSVFSFSQSYVTGDYADTWTVYAAAQITLNGNSIHSGSDTEGPLETASVSWTDTLSTTGPGTFAEADQHRFTNTCGANDYYAYTDRNLTVSQPTIATPQPNPYGAGYWAMWYFNGFNYYNTVNLTASPNLGTCSGCSPAYGWEIIDQPSGAAAVSFSSTTSTQTTVTSQMASSGPEFDVSIVFTVDGFASAKLWMNLNTPVGLWASSIDQVGNPGGCSGYDSQYHYVVYDLWGYALSDVVPVSEVNDVWVADVNNITGWYKSPQWEDDDVWSPPGMGIPTWDSQYLFTDHLTASDCDVPGTWVPAPVSPQNLNSAVQHALQTFYVGSYTDGQGVKVQTDTQQYYTDHGTAQ